MDEVDLLRTLRDVPPPSPEANDRARVVLYAVMTEPVDVVARVKRWFSLPRFSERGRCR